MNKFELELKNTFISIMVKGRKDNTYKFALSRYLLEYVQKMDPETINHKTQNQEDVSISYDDIAKGFLKYYWHQEFKYRIKQNYQRNKPPHIVKIIRQVFGTRYIPDTFEDLQKTKKGQELISNATELIRKKIFWKESSKSSVVIPRFQNVKTGSQTTSKKLFYHYDDESGNLFLNSFALDFFNKNNILLTKLVILEWSKYLEKLNTLPRLIAKISSSERKRGGLRKYVKIFKDFKTCFYCNAHLDKSLHIDHFIPWSYIFEDEAWNLVPACPICNCKKHDSLAGSDYLSELINRNRMYKKQIRELNLSISLLETTKGWETEIKQHYLNCQRYGFGSVSLP